MEKISIRDKLALFSEHWSPKIIAELNGQQVKLAKLQGEFIWHQHETEDELFYVLKGRLHMDFRDRTVTLGPGEMIVVPRGTGHRPRCEEETHILLFEPASTVNTGEEEENERTKKTLDRI